MVVLQNSTPCHNPTILQYFLYPPNEYWIFEHTKNVLQRKKSGSKEKETVAYCDKVDFYLTQLVYGLGAFEVVVTDLNSNVVLKRLHERLLH